MGCDAVPNDEQHASHATAVAALEAELSAEMRPTGTLGRLLVRRVAVLAARLDRCERHDAAMTGRRVRDAATRRADDRRAEVEALAQKLRTDPAEAAMRLRRTPEGVDYLLDACRRLRDDVGGGGVWYHMRPAPPCELARLMGKTSRDLDDPGLIAAGDVVAGRNGQHPDSLRPEPQRQARDLIVAAIDREMDALEDLRDRVDGAAEAADRDEAAARALFDPSPEAERARRYEAATERGLFRALREFAQVEKRARADAADPAPPPAPAQAPAPAPAPTPEAEVGAGAKRTQTPPATVAAGPAAIAGTGGDPSAKTNPSPSGQTSDCVLRQVSGRRD